MVRSGRLRIVQLTLMPYCQDSNLFEMGQESVQRHVTSFAERDHEFVQIAFARTTDEGMNREGVNS